MKNICFLIIYLLTSLLIIFSIKGELYPQSQEEADSLHKVITHQPEGLEKADNLLKLGRILYFINIDSAFRYYEQAYILSGKLNYIEGQADASYMKSLIYRGKADYTSSFSNIEKYIKLVLYLEDSLRLAKGYYQLGSLLQEISDYDLALYYCQKSLALYIPLKDTIGMLGNYNSVGLIYHGKSEFDTAAYYYLKAITLCDQFGEENKMSSIFNNLGDVYYDDEQYDNAKKYYNMSLEINLKYNKTRSIALNYTNLGRVAKVKDEFQEALDYYNQAAELYEQAGDNNGIIEIINNYGDTYLAQKKYALAMEKFDNALKKYRKTGYIRGMIVALRNKAAVYSALGDTKQALALQDSSLTLTYQEGGKELRIDVLTSISNEYRKAGDYRKAFEYQERKYKLQDSVYNIKKTKVINDLVQKYEKEKDQANILVLEKDNLQKDLNLRKRTSQRNVYLFSGLAVIVLTLFIVFYLRQRAARDKIIARQKIRQLEEEKKLMGAKLLVEGQEEERKRIATELHDGLGVLLSATKMQISLLSNESPENKALIGKAIRMLEQATGDVRKISHNMMPGLLTKLGFFEAVEDLFEDIVDTRGLDAVCSISGNQDRLAANKEIMLYRIVQEMVNNTLKHAEAGKIELQIRVLQDMLDLNYTDNGKGFDIVQKLESGSLGLKSIQSRVSFLNGNLTVKSKPGEGVSYAVQVPV